MESDLLSTLELTLAGSWQITPELTLSAGIVTGILIGLIRKLKLASGYVALAFFFICLTLLITQPEHSSPAPIFNGFIRPDDFSWFIKILIDLGGIFTVVLSLRNPEIQESRFKSEFYTLLLAAVLGAHLLVMSTNFIMIFLSLELLSISSYILAGFNASKKGAEGSLKYFLFGSVASAVMLYGFSILFGLTGTIDFSSTAFVDNLITNESPLKLVAGIFCLGGFLYKIAAVPMHPWAPDVYEASPMPVIAFLSVVPKLAGLIVLTRFTLALHLFGQSSADWQLIVSVIAMLSITVGNFSALWQQHPKRMMAYSSIAHAGFLLIGVASFSIQGLRFMLFYCAVYLMMNYIVFSCLQAFEKNTIIMNPSFQGVGKKGWHTSILLLVGLVALAGIPPTAGFTGKLFIFTGLWSAYELTGKEILIWLQVFGLLNTVVALFYYLKIPYYAFVKNEEQPIRVQKTTFENLFALILVTGIVFLFIQPDVLMGWLNRLNFVL